MLQSLQGVRLLGFCSSAPARGSLPQPCPPNRALHFLEIQHKLRLSARLHLSSREEPRTSSTSMTFAIWAVANENAVSLGPVFAGPRLRIRKYRNISTLSLPAPLQMHCVLASVFQTAEGQIITQIPQYHELFSSRLDGNIGHYITMDVRPCCWFLTDAGCVSIDACLLPRWETPKLHR